MTVTSRHRVQLITKTLKTIPKSFSYRRHQWGLETDLVFVDAVDDGNAVTGGAVDEVMAVGRFAGSVVAAGRVAGSVAVGTKIGLPGSRA